MKFPLRQCGRIALLVIVMASLPAVALRADWFVAPNGDDGSPGTRDRPFATLEIARDAVAMELAADPNQHLTVWLRGGIYRLEKPITFTHEHSPGPEGSVRFKAFRDEVPVISGGRRIEGWQVGQDGNWRVVLPDVKSGLWRFRELYVNGVRQTRARHPNEGWLRVHQAGADRRTSFTFEPGDLSVVSDLDQVELLFLHDWSTTRVSVRSIDESEHVLTVAHPIGNRAPHYAIDHFEPHPRYALENSQSYLDQGGEWYLNRTTGELFYRPRAGETPENVEAIAPVARALLEVNGNDATGQPVRNLHFEGLHFEHCAWSIPAMGYAGIQAAFHEQRGDDSRGSRGFVPAALSFELSVGCVIRDSRIAHLGGSGIRFGRQCRDNQLIHTIVTDISANGVMLGEDTSRHVGGKPWWQAAADQVATGNRIEDCLIERCGQQFMGSVGIWGGLTRQTLIRDNEIRDLPYTGVSLGWMWNPTPTPSRENKVIGNHIHHVMQILSDGGGIYTLGRQPGSELRGNLIHDVPLNLGRAESNGMFLDEGTTDVVVADNVIYRVDKSPLRFHRATTNLVARNLLVVKPGVDSIRYNSTEADDIQKVDNTIAVEHAE